LLIVVSFVSVSVLSIAWNDLSLKWPDISWVGCYHRYHRSVLFLSRYRTTYSNGIFIV